jgi:hypothetical protein
MHNWVAFEYLCKERIADALRWADNERLVQAVRESARVRRGETARRERMGREPRPATLVLARGELLSVRVGRRGLALTCVAGRTWATTNRISADVILLPGQSAQFPDRGTVVIEALRTATIRIEGLRQPRAVVSPWASAVARPRIAFFL